jgi:hypothetical protein
MVQLRHPIALIITFLWVGFVCAISFMEAWLKFTAPGVTLPIGLGIGKVVFGALNKMEWLLAAIIAGGLLLQWPDRIAALWVLVPIAALATQTLWLLPALDARAVAVVHGLRPAPSGLHAGYVGLEVVKVAGLVLFGITLFRPTRQMPRTIHTGRQ